MRNSTQVRMSALKEEGLMFKAGDAIVHPIRGAGVVERVEERPWRGRNDVYYRIKLLSHPGINLMIPISAAEALGLRRAIPRSKLKKVWRVLGADPKTLPDEHKKRCALLEDKLHAGDVFRVAEAVRDMTWRRKRRGNLTTTGKQLYKEGMGILAGEIAATQGLDMGDAEAQVRERLSESLSPAPVM
jgi:CarD family transcriptional regulator